MEIGKPDIVYKFTEFYPNPDTFVTLSDDFRKFLTVSYTSNELFDVSIDHGVVRKTALQIHETDRIMKVERLQGSKFILILQRVSDSFDVDLIDFELEQMQTKTIFQNIPEAISDCVVCHRYPVIVALSGNRLLSYDMRSNEKKSLTLQKNLQSPIVIMPMKMPNSFGILERCSVVHFFQIEDLSSNPTTQTMEKDIL